MYFGACRGTGEGGGEGKLWLVCTRQYMSMYFGACRGKGEGQIELVM